MGHKINLYLKRGKYCKEEEEQECGQKGRETIMWVMCMWLGKMQKAEIKGKGADIPWRRRTRECAKIAPVKLWDF